MVLCELSAPMLPLPYELYDLIIQHAVSDQGSRPFQPICLTTKAFRASALRYRLGKISAQTPADQRCLLRTLKNSDELWKEHFKFITLTSVSCDMLEQIMHLIPRATHFETYLQYGALIQPNARLCLPSITRELITSAETIELAYDWTSLTNLTHLSLTSTPTDNLFPEIPNLTHLMLHIGSYRDILDLKSKILPKLIPSSLQLLLMVCSSGRIRPDILPYDILDGTYDPRIVLGALCSLEDEGYYMEMLDEKLVRYFIMFESGGGEIARLGSDRVWTRAQEVVRLRDLER